MKEKIASVHWEGRGKLGHGRVSTESGSLNQAPYGYTSRFIDDEHEGTNPEEILGAAFAACFTMAFSFACDKAGYATAEVDTQAHVRLRKEGDGFLIDRIVLRMQARVPGLEEHAFQQIAQGAKQNCPVGKALAAVPEIELDATLWV